MSLSSDSSSPEDEQNIPSSSELVPVDATVEETHQETEVASESAEIASTAEAMLPPEAQGEANGGPLGCCLGIVVGLLLTFFVITIVSITIHNGGYLGIATLPVGILGAIIGGFSGWKIGRAIYHEYELSPERKKRLERWERRWKVRGR